jgi:ankyrin repeat protein
MIELIEFYTIASLRASAGAAAQMTAVTQTTLDLYYSIEEGGTVTSLSLTRDQLSAWTANNTTSRYFQHPTTGNSFLYASVLSGQVDMVAMVMEYVPIEVINVANGEGMTPLHEACAAGNFDIVQLLLSHGADVQCTDMLGDTTLIMLCDGNDCFGTLATLNLLLSFESIREGVNAQNHSGDTALMAACENNLCSVVEVLLKHHHADVHVQNRGGETAAVLALSMCHFEVLEMLLMFGLDVNEVMADCEFETLLLRSCALGMEEAVLFLLQHGASVEAGSARSGETSLILASRHGYTRIVTLLLQHGADVDAVDGKLRSALYMACRYGHVETVNVLLYSCPDLDQTSSEGDTALAAACERGDLVLLRMLQQQGAGIDGCDNLGRSVLERAVRGGRGEVARFLLDKGCAACQLCGDCEVRHTTLAVVSHHYCVVLCCVTYMLCCACNGCVMDVLCCVVLCCDDVRGGIYRRLWRTWRRLPAIWTRCG